MTLKLKSKTKENRADFRGEYQRFILQHVSRTFALTIPHLPEGLSRPVANAYLLCRITDTIEDDSDLTIQEKKQFFTRFYSVLNREEDAEKFALDLTHSLSKKTVPAERNLVLNSPLIVEETLSYRDEEQVILKDCVRTMARGMFYFQENRSAEGLENLAMLNSYCYYVAGVVGEMLTRLFCLYDPRIGKHHDRLMELSLSFGQGLQMVNIIKDTWDDQQNSVCWFPVDVFQCTGYDLKGRNQFNLNESYSKGVLELVKIARYHLDRSMEYIRLIPPDQKGIRMFNLWGLFMAYATLRKVTKTPLYQSGREVKISRPQVAWLYQLSSAASGSNTVLSTVEHFLRKGVPLPETIPDRSILMDLGL